MAKARYKSLVHEGPLFPEKYAAKGFSFDGKKLTDQAEEMIWHWAIRRDTDYVKLDVAKKNFIASLKSVAGFELASTDDPKFKKLVDEMFVENEKIKETKKNKTKAQKDAEKVKREELKEKYGFATVDGKKVPINGFMIEAAGPLISRGNDPRLFTWKRTTEAGDVTVNLVAAPKEVVAAMKAKGFKVVSDPGVLWVFKYDIEITGKHPALRKKVNFGAASEIAQGQDKSKHEKALKLLKKWDAMQKHIEAGCKSGDEFERQRALVTYLIQKTGIRVGNDRDLDSYADTAGASTLKVGDVDFKGDVLQLHFLGKDSVPYFNEVELDPWAAKALKDLARNRCATEQLFDKVKSFDVGNFIKEVCPEASPKTFRSAIGTAALCEALAASKIGVNDEQKKAAFVRANLHVGKVLNHQKNIGKNYGDQAKKMNEAVAASKQKLIDLGEDVSEKEVELKKKLALAEKNGMKDAAANLRERIKKNNERLVKATMRVEALETKKDLKEATKQTALGTSLNSYCSPLVVYSWCKDVGVPTNKIYTKSQTVKFDWAATVSKDYWKSYLGYLKAE